MRRWIAFVALVLAGCGTVARDEEPETAPTDAGTVVPADETPAPALVEGEPDPANPGFLVGPAFVDSGGATYRRLVMAENNPVLTIDKALITPELESEFGAESLREAVSVTARFAAEELATSFLAFDYTVEGADLWWGDNEDAFTSGAPDVVLPALRATEGPDVLNSRALLYTNNGWDRGTPLTETRVEDLSVELESMTATDEGLALNYVVRFVAPVDGPDGTNGEYTERTTLWADYTVVETDGRWLIGSYSTQWQTSY